MDFGSRINCMVVCQEDVIKNEFKVLKNFYIEHDVFDKILDEFIEYYQHHKEKSLYLWGGSEGKKRTSAASKESYFEMVQDKLAKGGWKVYLMAQMHEILHMDKYLYYIEALSGDNINIPMLKINGNNASESYVSMKDAEIDKIEIKKDKSSERNDNIPQWKATHISDAIDNIYYWKYYHHMNSDHSPSFDIQIK